MPGIFSEPPFTALLSLFQRALCYFRWLTKIVRRAIISLTKVEEECDEEGGVSSSLRHTSISPRLEVMYRPINASNCFLIAVPSDLALPPMGRSQPQGHP